jgi:hypothetical protein
MPLSNSSEPDVRTGQPLSVMVFSATLFLSAALLFLVEPMFAKMVLPLLGGSAAVWTTCLAFFQVALLAGYAYAHASASLLGFRTQVALHAVVLVAAVALLPVGVPAGWTPPVQADPVLWLLRLLLVAVGLPFFALSGTTPMLQKWFAQSDHPRSDDPYFLYAASNAGSLLGLLCYPLVIEPALRLGSQSRLWSYGYWLFLLSAAGSAVIVWHSRRFVPMKPDAKVDIEEAPALDDRTPAAQTRFLWVALAFVPSSLMLGVTTLLTTDIPAFPLFWVLPLSIYLLSFVLVFKRKPFLLPDGLRRRVPLLILAAITPVVLKGALPLAALFAIDLLVLFAIAMVFHGEVAGSRPSARHLTEFYFWVSLGGVLGGIFNALIAPVIFHTVLEYPITLVLAALLYRPFQQGENTPRARALDFCLPIALGCAVALGIVALQSRGVEPGKLFNLVIFAPALVCCLVGFAARPLRFGLGIAALIAAAQLYSGPFGHIIHNERSFFGAYRVSDDRQNGLRLLFHGGTSHGVQSLDPARACEPLAYYSRGGPIGQVFQAYKQTKVEDNVALIGLGAGVMASYQQPGRNLTFYEIDPVVVHIARDRQYFTYLSSCAPNARIVLGDARLELRKAIDHEYGTIVLDAFSGDSVPTHLLTREALELYLQKLAPNGVLAFHISNRYLELHGVLAALARDAGLVAMRNDDAAKTSEEARQGIFASWWVVMARQADDLNPLGFNLRWKTLEEPPNMPVWTDDYSNIVSILKFN